ncbi:MAG: diguanylate cyclase [Clostridiales bacterium]|nr:diguanylate cyclase [Clostridiales bacterium]
MRFLRTAKNYFFYSGIEKDEYNAVKKDAYISNYEVWRILHFVMAATFAFLYISSLFNELLGTNRLFYLIALAYSVIASILFLVLKKDSLIAQLIIYLSISLLFVFAALITQNKPEIPATTFIAFLLLAPMFMIDKPFFMTFELAAASTVFLVWMYNVKPFEIWQMDMINIVIFTIVGIILNIIANSVRIKEFTLTRKINIQKDTDELTGLKNKGALIREIQQALDNAKIDKGILFVMDVDHFKQINDTYGHDVGDNVICQLGHLLGRKFVDDEIAGRFGGDEFIIFIRNTDDKEFAASIAKAILEGASENVKIPGSDRIVKVSIGIAIYQGLDKSYTEIFKKADTALYRSKADTEHKYNFYE